MLCLLGNPFALAALRKEIDDGIASGDISSPITDAESRKLPYLQAVIREGLRMFPPATSLLSKLVPLGGDTLPDTICRAAPRSGTTYQWQCK